MNEVLTHHGVKGMKWGVRRTSSLLGRRRQQRKKFNEMSKYYDERRDHHKTYMDDSSLSTSQWLSKASKAAQKDIVKKYGEKTVSDWNKYNASKSNSKSTGLAQMAGIAGGLSVAALVAMKVNGNI